MIQKVKKILISSPAKFLQGGLLLNAVSFLNNFIAGQYLSLNKEMIYFFVLVCDFILGFFINRHFVFSESKSNDGFKVFLRFILAGILFRFINWLIYVNILRNIDLYFMYAQFLSTLIVLGLKYTTYKKIFK